MSIFLTLVIAFFGGLTSLIPSVSKKMFDFRSNGTDIIKRSGWGFIASLVLVFALTAFQDWYNDKESEEKEKTAKREKKTSDSLIKMANDSTLLEMKKKFDTTQMQTVKLLLEYGFKADLANDRLVKIVKDSSKTKVIEAASPVLSFCFETGIQRDSLTKAYDRYLVSMCSNDAGSTDFSIDFHIVIRGSGKLVYIGKRNFLTKRSTIASGASVTSFLGIMNAPRYEVLYIMAEGYYSNIDKTKKIPFNEACRYVLGTKEFSQVSGDMIAEIETFVKSNKRPIN